jgi:uroporphyrinogen-III decarboxylase
MNNPDKLLTGKSRVLNAMLNKPTDRVSVHPAIDISYASALFGKTIGECFISPVIHARALENVFSVHPGIDGLYVNLCLSPKCFVSSRKEGDVTKILDNGGMTWYIPSNDVGTVGDHLIKYINDPRLKTQNPLKDGIIDTYNAIRKEIKDKYLIVPGLTGPFSQLVFMLGLTETLLLIYDQPDDLKQALEWRTLKAVEWADELINSGVESVWIGEGAASSSIISPETYTEFVLPYAAKVVDHLNSNGVTTIMHVCGDINQSVDIIARTGVNALDIDYMVDLKSARKAVERQICLRGNLNPVDLLNMPYDELIIHCKKIISSGGSPFVLSTGCLVARDTPKENIEAMVAASFADKLQI